MPDDRVEDLIRAEARKQGVPSALALAVAEQESGFNPTLTNPEKVGNENATGVFQLLPSTAKGLGVDPTDARQNITGGVKYLRQLLDKHQGIPDKVLAEYGGVKTDTKYVPAVTARYQKYKPIEDAADTTFFSQAARGTAGGVQPPGAPPPVTPGAPAPTVGTPMPAGAAMAFPPGQEPNLVPGAPGIQALEGGGLLKDIGMGIVRAHNPATFEGRQNLFGLGGELAATAFAPEVQGPIWAQRAMRVGAPLVGAMVASGTEAAAENAMGFGDGTSAPMAAATQGMYNAAGTAVMWPIRRLGKLFIGSTVARNARTMLEENLTRAGDRMRSDVNALRAKRDEAIEAAKLLTQNAVETIRTAGNEAMAKLPTARAAGAAVRSGVGTQSRAQITALASKEAATELTNNAALADVRALFNDVSAQFSEPGMIRTAQLAREVFTGPTKVALDQSGERVAAAAAAGPPISIEPVQETLARITEVAKPAELFGTGDQFAISPSNVGVLANLAANTQGKGGAVSTMATPAPVQTKMTAAEFKAWVAAERAEADPVKQAPVPEILARIRDLAEPEMEFSTAHALKRLLDERVNWDKAAKSINEQLTKATRIALREQLSVSPEYSAANATYESLVNLYRKGLGGKMRRAFINDPDAAANLLNPNKPIAARMLHSLLVEQGAAGGDAQLGQQAWDAARSTFIHQKLLDGGLEGLEKKLTKLTSTQGDFSQAVFGDTTGQSVLHNLQAIVHGYNNVLADNAKRTAQLRLAGRLERSGLSDEGTHAAAAAADAAQIARDAQKTATQSEMARARAKGGQQVREAKSKGNAAIETARETGKANVEKAAEAKAAFGESSLSKPTPSIAGTLGDLGHVMYTKGQTRGGFIALLRLLNGPSSADLLTWMALSPSHTQMFVRATTSPFNERAGSELLRSLVGMLTPGEPTAVPAQAQGAGPAGAPPAVAPAGAGPGPRRAPRQGVS